MEQETLFPDFFKLKGDGWCDLLFSDEMEELINETLEKLPKSGKGGKPAFYPAGADIFRCFYETPYEEVKMVILGQDPYPEGAYHNGSATGLCFDVKKGNLIDRSLQNIYKELKNEGFYPTEDGCLLHWAKQGVLMMNTALTVEPGTPESHLEIWVPFIEKVFKRLAEKDGVIWILLGQKTEKWKSMIPDTHKICEASHPSAKAFMGSGIFKEVNDILYKSGKDKIVW